MIVQVFYGRTINKQPIPVNKRIFVLEDFDAAGLEDVVNNRSETSNEGQNSKVEDVCDFIASKMFMTSTRIRKSQVSIFVFQRLELGTNYKKRLSCFNGNLLPFA